MFSRYFIVICVPLTMFYVVYLSLCRFGGLAYGEVNRMAQLNGTEFKKFTDGLLEAVQASSTTRGNSLWPEIINNVDELLARLVTKENGKVIHVSDSFECVFSVHYF